MTNWKPSPSDLAWCQNLIKMTRDGAMWGSSNGIMIFDHKAKTLTLMLRSPMFEQETHERNIVCFKACGYEVKDTTPEGTKK